MASVVVVPTRWEAAWHVKDVRPDGTVESHGPGWVGPIEFDFVWRARDQVKDDSPRSTSIAHISGKERHIEWRIVFLEQALILLIGGGLLTFIVRRERRRKAAA